MIPWNDWFSFTNHVSKVHPGSEQHMPVHQIERTEQINGLPLNRHLPLPTSRLSQPDFPMDFHIFEETHGEGSDCSKPHF